MATPTPFDPIALLQVASDLSKNTHSQARLRSAIGRAYYAMFLLAREKTGIRDQRGVHDKVIGALIERGERFVAGELGKLRRLREVADYLLVPAAEDRDWRANWEQAQRIVMHIRPRLEAMHVTRPARPSSEE